MLSHHQGCNCTIANSIMIIRKYKILVMSPYLLCEYIIVHLYSCNAMYLCNIVVINIAIYASLSSYVCI